MKPLKLDTKTVLGIAAGLAVVYLILKPKSLKTSSPAKDKMQLTCAEGEKLVEEPTGMRCVPVAEVVSGPTPSVSFAGEQDFDFDNLEDFYEKKQKFSNPNISGVPVRIVNSFDAKSRLSADGSCPVCGMRPCCCARFQNYVDTKSNNFFQAKPGGFYK